MLTDGGQERLTASRSRSVGFLDRGGEPATGAVAVRIPDALDAAETSVCGIKGFLVDERRIFVDEDGGEHGIDCAKIAVLDIADSPVHVHGETLETYQVLAGQGRMVLDEQVLPVGPGTVIVIPPGVEHGLAADDPQRPLRVLMTFTPGLAPVAHQEWRDERICFPRASRRIDALTAP